MFEFDQVAAYPADLATPELPYQPVTDISEMSLLIWGEHCIECAAPACYSTCDLYESLRILGAADSNSALGGTLIFTDFVGTVLRSNSKNGLRWRLAEIHGSRLQTLSRK